MSKSSFAEKLLPCNFCWNIKLSDIFIWENKTFLNEPYDVFDGFFSFQSAPICGQPLTSPLAPSAAHNLRLSSQMSQHLQDKLAPEVLQTFMITDLFFLHHLQAKILICSIFRLVYDQNLLFFFNVTFTAVIVNMVITQTAKCQYCHCEDVSVLMLAFKASLCVKGRITPKSKIGYMFSP